MKELATGLVRVPSAAEETAFNLGGDGISLCFEFNISGADGFTLTATFQRIGNKICLTMTTNSQGANTMEEHVMLDIVDIQHLLSTLVVTYLGNVNPEFADPLERYKKETSLDIENLTDDNFKVGGMHKKYAPNIGILQAQDNTGRKDFDKEDFLNKYANYNYELKRYISTQTKIAPPFNVDKTKQYAKVDIYDPKNVQSKELDECIDNLSHEQLTQIVIQLTEMLHVLYKNGISHRDLHMHNLLVHINLNTGDVYLKAIDFGHAKVGEESKRFDDIKYLFNQQARSFPETQYRNIRSESSQKMLKHYPLHKLLERMNFDKQESKKLLNQSARKLESMLKLAGDNKNLIADAFWCTRQDLCLAISTHSIAICSGIVNLAT
ncbi:TPA: protein kinase family protein [Yersinia enterocolitica]|nr:protein kinase family protein [Yersinia enterocolitica]